MMHETSPTTLDDVLQEFIASGTAPTAEHVREWINRYPQFSHEIIAFAIELPHRTGVEDWRTGRGFQLIDPLDSDFDIRTVIGYAKGFKRALKSLCRPFGTRSGGVSDPGLTSLRQAQGRPWANIFRPYGADICRSYSF